jgi:plasmid stabilization system protein ParE
MELVNPIIWSPEADLDLEQILGYLENKWSVYVVQDFINNLFSTLEWISFNPDSFMQVNKSDNIRKYVLSEHYTLYFEVFDKHIDLLRIFDNRQNPNKLSL